MCLRMTRQEFFTKNQLITLEAKMIIRVPNIFKSKNFRIKVQDKSTESNQPPAKDKAETPQSSFQNLDKELHQKPAPALIHSLDDADPFVRAVSCEVLGRLKEKDAVGPHSCLKTIPNTCAKKPRSPLDI